MMRRTFVSLSQGAAVLALALGPAGCVPKIDDDLSTVLEPRILAVQTQAVLDSGDLGPAELPVGAKGRLSVLVAAPENINAPRVDYRLCLDRKPLTELGPVSPRCLTRTSDPGVETALGTGDSVDVTVPRDACSVFGPDPPPQKTSDEPAGRAADPDVTGGYYEPVVAFLGGTEKALGMIRLDCGVANVPRAAKLAYNERHRPNENPKLDELSLVDHRKTQAIPADDGATAAVVVARGESVSLRATFAVCPRKAKCGDALCTVGETKETCADDCTTDVGCTGAESYAYYDATTLSTVDRREGISVSWYATAGDITERRTGVAETDADLHETETGWTAPEKPGDALVWAVIRDDRGGVSWERYRLRVE